MNGGLLRYEKSHPNFGYQAGRRSHWDEAKGDIFDYLELFYNCKRRHGFNGQLSPVEYEQPYPHRRGSGWRIGRDSDINSSYCMRFT